MLAARMRHGDVWRDANILNISSRGLLLYAPKPPSRGMYVEVRRGAFVIVGRVIWAEADRFGVRAQERLSTDSLISNILPKAQAANDGDAIAERRARPRSEALKWRYVQNSEKGRALQFLFVAGLGFLLVACAYEAVRETLSQTLSIASTQLADAH